jgi:hypothetical protein
VALRARVEPTPCLEEAAQVSARIRPPDLLVRGWDRVAFTEDLFSASRHRYLDIVQAATEHGAGAAALLRAAREETWARGGSVYYLGLLETDRRGWDFIGNRAGLSWEALADARAHATVTLWRERGPARAVSAADAR